MAPQIWDPDRTLNINAFDNGDMFCVGVAVTRGNARCRWRIASDRHNKVCLILQEMGTKPPTEIFGSKLLSRLAKLSLCEERHQYQNRDILKRWEDLIEDVASQYEEIEKLRRLNCQLKTRIAKEAEEGDPLESSLSDESDNRMKRLSARFEARESDLLLQIKTCENLLAESREQGELLAMQEAESSRLLARERRISAQRQQDHEVAAKQVAELQVHLSGHRQMLERLRRDLEKATTDREGLLAQTESLRVQSATESRSLNQVKRNLDEAKATQANLLKEKENLESLLATEHQISSGLEKKLESLDFELTNVRGELERTRLNLTESRKVNEEQAAAHAAHRAATSAETARLLERIRQLEEESRFSFLAAFMGRMKRLAVRIALRATGGKWPRRGNTTQVEMV